MQRIIWVKGGIRQITKANIVSVQNFNSKGGILINIWKAEVEIDTNKKQTVTLYEWKKIVAMRFDLARHGNQAGAAV